MPRKGMDSENAGQWTQFFSVKGPSRMLFYQITDFCGMSLSVSWHCRMPFEVPEAYSYTASLHWVSARVEERQLVRMSLAAGDLSQQTRSEHQVHTRRTFPCWASLWARHTSCLPKAETHLQDWLPSIHSSQFLPQPILLAYPFCCIREMPSFERTYSKWGPMRKESW